MSESLTETDSEQEKNKTNTDITANLKYLTAESTERKSHFKNNINRFTM